MISKVSRFNQNGTTEERSVRRQSFALDYPLSVYPILLKLNIFLSTVGK